jgi:hypothetical protein
MEGRNGPEGELRPWPSWASREEEEAWAGWEKRAREEKRPTRVLKF